MKTLKTPTISLCMMVLNEEAGLKRAIDSCREYVDEVVISVDSKSTDKTLAIAKEHADIVEIHEWKDDFAVARNEVQAKCTSEWVLILDGHEFVEQWPVNLKQLLAMQEKLVNGIGVTLKHENGSATSSPRILKQDVKWRYKVHNLPDLKNKAGTCVEFIVRHDRETGQSKESNTARDIQRNEMLERVLRDNIKNDPKDVRSLYYLAQFMRTEETAPEAIELYKKYLDIGTWDEERYNAIYCLIHVLMFQERYGECLDYADMLEKELPDRNETHLIRGKLYFYTKNYYLAISEFLQGLNMVNKRSYAFYPEGQVDGQLWDTLSLCYYNIKQREMAVICAGNAIKELTDIAELQRVANNIVQFNKVI